MKNNLTTKQASITIGIPTCYGGESLVTTVKSIRTSGGNYLLRIIIVSDRNPISPTISDELKNLGVELYWNNIEGSQFKKIRQMVAMTSSDIYISTQDDITFDKNVIQEILKAFTQDKNLTMAGIRVLPLPPVTIFESIMASMLRIVDKIGLNWNNGDNRLNASGRCLAFKADHLKKFKLLEKVVNGDMYMYLENKKLDGKFKLLKNAKLFIRCPQSLKDQIGPSSRYQYQKEEIKSYFDFDISREYKIPLIAVFKAVISEFTSHPLQASLYFVVFVYTRIRRQHPKVVSNPVWQVDLSTKKVN